MVYLRPDEQQARLLQICEWLMAGRSIIYCAARLRISKQRVHYIVKKNGLQSLITKSYIKRTLERRLKRVKERTRRCIHCGKTFIPGYEDSKFQKFFCSRKCRKEGYKPYRARYMVMYRARKKLDKTRRDQL